MALKVHAHSRLQPLRRRDSAWLQRPAQPRSRLPASPTSRPALAQAGARGSRGALPAPQAPQQAADAPQQAAEDACSPSAGAADSPPAPWRLPAWLRRRVLLTGLIPLGAGVDWWSGASSRLSGYGNTAQSVAVMAAIIFVHELGHFLAARGQGILVSEFSVGFGPALFSRKVEGVLYSLRAVPLGGYVAFPDDELDAAFDKDDPNLMKNRPLRERFAVISAGVVFNLAFAFAVLFGQASSIGIPSGTFLPGVFVPNVQAGSPAAAAGLQSGDLITSLDGQRVPADPAAVEQLVNRIRDSPQRQLPLKVQRGPDRREVVLSVMPDRTPEGSGRIGVSLESHLRAVRLVAHNPWEAAGYAGKEFSRLLNVVLSGFSRIFTEPGEAAAGLTGPLGVVAAGADVAKRDRSGLCQFAAVVNINLAIINTLPLPALDGGFMALLLLEAARGKKLDKQVEQNILASGLLLLLTLGSVLVLRDTLQLSGLTTQALQ